MYLLKCKCGCLFTLKEFPSRWPVCPDCRKEFVNLSADFSLRDISRVCTETGLMIRVIPDDAKISVTFDP